MLNIQHMSCVVIYPECNSRTISHGINFKTDTIDMSDVLNVAIRHRPKLIIVSPTSYPRTTD